MTQSTRGTVLLDKAAMGLRAADDVTATLDRLVSELQTLRQQLAPELWNEFVTIDCRQHPLTPLLHQDPFTSRAFHKPRGYAGDAVMLDFIYASEDGLALADLEASTDLGKRICSYTSNGAAPRAVRARRRVIIETLESLPARRPRPHVLSLACGHAREAKHCSALLEGRLGRYVAMDQDIQSLDVVRRELSPLGVEAIHVSVRDLLRGKPPVTGFDLIYVSGLHDYLSVRIAQRLSEVLFEMLNPGGQLILSNYLPNLINSGYMEAFMDWWLIYRTQGQLVQLVETLPEHKVGALEVWTEENQIIAFLQAERAG